MIEGYRESCVSSVDRLGNDELRALMMEVVQYGGAAYGRAPLQQLLAKVEPLLKAFFEGQVQAGRLGCEAVDGLVRQAFTALYRRRAGYEPDIPFRAWMIDVARSTLLQHLRSQNVGASCAPVANTATLHFPEAFGTL
ncbi:hypothetical protein ACLEJQ_02645 [Pseudomonas sp. SMV71]|uniref:hypothetical protein n=1 Tax=Pseudomonas sp. SMV71 TaxID=3390195 RepID=UPI003F8594B2